MANAPERIDQRGTPLKVNITDPDDAKMRTSKDVIQGIICVAAFDNKHQMISHAHAYNAGQEQQALESMLIGIHLRFRQGQPECEAKSRLSVYSNVMPI